MTLFQIISISVLSAGTLVALVFASIAIIESFTTKRVKKNKPIKVEEKEEEISEIDLDEMLAKLEEISKEKKEEQNKEVQPAPQKLVIEVKNAEPIKEEKVEEKVEEIKPIIETIPEEDDIDDFDEDFETEFLKIATKEEKESVKEEKQPIIVVNNNESQDLIPEFDYRVRVRKIKESEKKLDKDLEKAENFILKYDRTIRRKERNQKMLDRRAMELTNLNLLMYSVTDIKNIDADKKTRQEELTTHISELKASIQDADEFLDANKEKYDSNIKLRDYLKSEKARYKDEIKELEALIASGKFFDDDDK